jgi:deoxyribonuclease-4
VTGGRGPRIGAHVSARGGLLGALASARALAVDAAQIWGSSPRAWAPPNVPDELADEFRRAWRAEGFGPLFLHTPYLVNVASPDEAFRRRSVDLAAATVRLAERVGAEGVVVHAGAGGAATDPEVARDRAARSLVEVARDAERTWVLIELMAGTAGAVASTFGEVRNLIDRTGGHRRIGVCADTCHLFAAGYALDAANGARACFDQVARLGLVRRFRLLHANDSRFGRGARRDRHTNIGHGLIGEDGFGWVLDHPTVRRVAVVCETPGTEAQRAADVAALRRLAARPPRQQARR